MCVDHTGLNTTCTKDNFPLPRIDQLVDGGSTLGLPRPAHFALGRVPKMSELLVGAVSDAARALGMSNVFVGVVVVAVIGNAAEHFSAVLMAARDKMDTAISIAVGSSTQIALFVAPVLVLASYFIAPEPMDLLFTVFEVVAVGLSVLTISMIAHDGETHWMEGVQLLAVYAILALGFYFLPSPEPRAHF